MIYLVYCTKCGKQVVGSSKNWESWLSNHKSHIKKKVKSCSIVKHFIDSCTATVIPSKYFRFINSSKEKIEFDLLLEKDKFWIETLSTIHKGLNGYHH